MATTFVTEEDYLRHRNKQDEYLRTEFGTQNALIEALETNLLHGFNSKLSNVNNTLSGRLGVLNEELGKVKYDLRNLQSEVHQVKEEVHQVKEEVHQVKEEVHQVKQELRFVHARLDQIDGRSCNKLRFLPTHKIEKVGVYQPGLGLKIPNYFPTTINHLWNLQFPKNKTRLAELVRFYDIHGYEHWGASDADLPNDKDADDTSSCESNSSFESDEPSQREQLLQDAIRDYPQRAVEELASYFGIDFEKIRKYYANRAQYQDRPQIGGTKRPPNMAGTGAVMPKRAKRVEPIPPKPDFEMHMPPRSGPSVKSSSNKSEEEMRLDWDVVANEKAEKDIADKILAHGTPTDEFSSNSQEQQVGGRKGSQKSSKGSKR